MIKRYFLRSLPEWVLCTVAAVTLCVNLLQSFVLPEAMYTDYVSMAVWTALGLAVLFTVGYSRRTVALGIPLLIVAAAAAVLLCHRSGISFLESDIPENNVGLWYLVVVVTALVVYLLSRTAGGAAVLCVFGALTHAWMCLLRYPFSDSSLIVFLVAALVLFAFRRYKRLVLKTSTRRGAYGAMFGIACAVAAVSVLCAALVWYFIIAPMDPPTKDVKLINRVVSLEVMEKVGISKVEVLMDDDLLSNQKDEDYERMTDETEDNEEEELQDENNNPPPMVEDEQAELTTPEHWGQGLTVRFVQLWTQHTFAAVLLLCLIVLLIAAAIALFLSRHKIWLNRLRKNTPRDRQVDILYHHLRKKLPLLGAPKFGADTPLEYAHRIQKQTAPLDRGGATWLELSETFSRLCYGGTPVTDEEYASYLSYYQNFFRCARKLCGARYLWRQFRL